MDKQTIRREIQSAQRELPGHLRRARSRFEKAFDGDSPQDVFIQAVTGAVAASLFLRLVRVGPFGRAVSSIAPMAVFAALYQYLLPNKR